ncbi:MAG: hypothetical protein IJ379_14500 [Lachnospiraceae bacterium]|nr:hypothetical protein [Lachnospiraceae bacterium]MBQ7777124.1 hypothetical protein [Lachnospiraceae bacterium]
MFPIFEQEKFATIGMLACFFLSLSIRIFLASLYRQMIHETDNMATTHNKLLKQCKLKFTNCYQLNNGVPNVPVFVEKFLTKLSLGPFSFRVLYHLSGQMMLLSVVFSGLGACRGIIAGSMFGEILPFYICSLVELYLYFAVSTMVDVKGKRNALKINLVDYLENHLSNRMQVTHADMQMLYGEKEKRNTIPRTLEILPIAGWLADKDEARASWTDADAELEPQQELMEQDKLSQVRMEEEEAEALEELLKEFLSLS